MRYSVRAPEYKYEMCMIHSLYTCFNMFYGHLGASCINNIDILSLHKVDMMNMLVKNAHHLHIQQLWININIYLEIYMSPLCKKASYSLCFLLCFWSLITSDGNIV